MVQGQEAEGTACRKRGGRGLRQMKSLEVWAASLKAKQLAAGRRERSLEVLYWLAVLKGKAHTLAEDTVVNTDTVPAGYLVVKAQWLRLEQRECEGKLRS